MDDIFDDIAENADRLLNKILDLHKNNTTLLQINMKELFILLCSLKTIVESADEAIADHVIEKDDNYRDIKNLSDKISSAFSNELSNALKSVKKHIK